MKKCNICLNANQHTEAQVASCNVCCEEVDCFVIDPYVSIGIAMEMKLRNELTDDVIKYAINGYRK